MIKDSQFFYLILGSVLAFSGGLVAYFIQFYHSRFEQRKLVKQFIRELLKDFTRISPKVREDYKRTGIIWNDVLQRINDSIIMLDRNKEHVFLIKENDLKEEILDFFSELRTTINFCYTLNNWIGSTIENIRQFASTEISKQPQIILSLELKAKEILEKIK